MIDKFIQELPKTHYTLDELTKVIGFRRGSLAIHLAGHETLADIACLQGKEIRSILGIGAIKLAMIKNHLNTLGYDGPLFDEVKRKRRAPKSLIR